MYIPINPIHRRTPGCRLSQKVGIIGLHCWLLNLLQACSVLRMLKLFGWESEMHERIAVRREEEVKWLWKRKFYDVIIAIVKCVLNHISRMIFYTGPWQLSDPCFDYARYICVSYAHMERRSKWYVNRTLQL